CLLLQYCFYCVFFFFSSRRLHTIFKCDWSSDVCSSDLDRVSGAHGVALPAGSAPEIARPAGSATPCAPETRSAAPPPANATRPRSEERRVGKQCRTGGAAENARKQKGRNSETEKVKRVD